MKITAFNGSPRGEKGNTHIMVEAFLEGARNVGAEVENVILDKYGIKGCRGCFSCWIHTPGKCVISDDMEELLEKAENTDILVFATPLYVDNVTGLMKNFMDRMIPRAQPYFAADDKGETRHVKRSDKQAPKIIVISNCGFPEQSHFQVLEHYYARVARNMHTEVIAQIYRGEGEFLRLKDPKIKPVIDQYVALLKKCGEEIFRFRKLTDETKAELEKPLIPYDIYLRHATRHWDAFLKK